MALAVFYFQLHQPFRLHPERSKFIWVGRNREIFRKVSDRCYLPALEMFTRIIRAHPRFRITLSMSGTFMRQAEIYNAEVIRSLQALFDAGRDRRQVEFLDETYYHSLAGLFGDRREFAEQVTMHRDRMFELFGFMPRSFRNTELMYNNEIARSVADMGYASILCEKREDLYRGEAPVSPNAVFRAKGTPLIVLPRNRELSDDVAFRFPHDPISPERYARHLAEVDGEAIVLGYDFEHIGEHISKDRGIFEFWEALPAALEAHANVVSVGPSEIADRFRDQPCPEADVHGLATSSWADASRDTFGWLGSRTQQALFERIEALAPAARRAGGRLHTRWRHLTTSDQLYFIHEREGEDHAVHAYFSPYDRSISEAARVLTDKIWTLESEISTFHIRRKTQRTSVIIISPETDRLPSQGMGQFARFVAGKSGGMGEVVAALCQGLTDRGIPVRLITLNLKRRFREKAGLTEQQWIEQRHRLDPEDVCLVSSSRYENHRSAYDGDPIETAAEFQRQIVNIHIKAIRSRSGGRSILHTHDWMAGGIIAGYARLRRIPLLHTIHNTHTGLIPLGRLEGVNLDAMRDNLYLVQEPGDTRIDANATAIKNADKVSLVGRQFLHEIINDHFQDRTIIAPGVRAEIQAKYEHDAAIVVPNGIAPSVYPENQKRTADADRPGLARRFTLRSRVIEAKKANLVRFQRTIGLRVDPESILLYWPSRLDETQKGIELLECIAQAFVEEHADAQIAVVGNPVGVDRRHADIMGRIACASRGQIAYARFDEDLSVLGYAAASDVFGASLYEPFGQIDVVGNLYGATATNRDTGGFADKIVHLSLKAWGAPQDHGNGVLFRHYSPSGLWWGLAQAVRHHRYFRKHPADWEAQAKRIMKEARDRWSLDNMVAQYMAVYEKMNGGKPLA